MGGAKRNRKPAKDDAYGWWMKGINLIEGGLGEVLLGLQDQHKAFRILAQRQDGDE